MYSNGTISDNNITNSSSSGISTNGYNLTIKGNTIKNNTGGILLGGSGTHYVYENNITDNAQESSLTIPITPRSAKTT